jgi:hypothetical protein
MIGKERRDLFQHLLDTALLFLVGMEYFEKGVIGSRLGSESLLDVGDVHNGVIEFHGTLGWTLLLLLLLGLGVNRRLVGLLRRLLPHLIESLLRLLR